MAALLYVVASLAALAAVCSAGDPGLNRDYTCLKVADNSTNIGITKSSKWKDMKTTTTTRPTTTTSWYGWHANRADDNGGNAHSDTDSFNYDSDADLSDYGRDAGSLGRVATSRLRKGYKTTWKTTTSNYVRDPDVVYFVWMPGDEQLSKMKEEERYRLFNDNYVQGFAAAKEICERLSGKLPGLSNFKKYDHWPNKIRDMTDTYYDTEALFYLDDQDQEGCSVASINHAQDDFNQRVDCTKAVKYVVCEYDCSDYPKPEIIKASDFKVEIKVEDDLGTCTDNSKLLCDVQKVNTKAPVVNASLPKQSNEGFDESLTDNTVWRYKVIQGFHQYQCTVAFTIFGIHFITAKPITKDLLCERSQSIENFNSIQTQCNQGNVTMNFLTGISASLSLEFNRSRTEQAVVIAAVEAKVSAVKAKVSAMETKFKKLNEKLEKSDDDSKSRDKTLLALVASCLAFVILGLILGAIVLVVVIMSRDKEKKAPLPQKAENAVGAVPVGGKVKGKGKKQKGLANKTPSGVSLKGVPNKVPSGVSVQSGASKKSKSIESK